jgi:phage shock protein C
MASYCTGCGASLPGGARFCSACGKPVFAGSVPGGRLTRPLAARKLAGVCAGLAMVLAVFAFPFGLIAYLVLWVIMPQEVPLLPAATHFDTA